MPRRHDLTCFYTSICIARATIEPFCIMAVHGYGIRGRNLRKDCMTRQLRLTCELLTLLWWPPTLPSFTGTGLNVPLIAEIPATATFKLSRQILF